MPLGWEPTDGYTSTFYMKVQVVVSTRQRWWKRSSTRAHVRLARERRQAIPIHHAERMPLPNPGRFDDLKNAAASILTLDNFEGARFEFNKTLTQKFALLHNVSLAAGQPGAYEFGAHVGDERTLLASRIDMAGRLTGRINTQVSDALG